MADAESSRRHDFVTFADEKKVGVGVVSHSLELFRGCGGVGGEGGKEGVECSGHGYSFNPLKIFTLTQWKTQAPANDTAKNSTVVRQSEE